MDVLVFFLFSLRALSFSELIATLIIVLLSVGGFHCANIKMGATLCFHSRVRDGQCNLQAYLFML